MRKFQISNFNIKNRGINISLLIFLIVIAIKQVFWVGIVPIWHFPDEQAHFAQVQNTSTFGVSKMLSQGIASTSDEIAQSEIILDTYRDSLGRNKYTFHPEYNLKYTNDTVGLWEDALNKDSQSYTTNYGLREATFYPFLYYLLAGVNYAIGLGSSLIVRVYLVRLLSVFLSVLIAFLAYKIGELIFNRKSYALLTAIMVSFQPMFSFVGAGVTSDVLFNLIFMAFLYACLLIMGKIDIARIIYLVITIVLGFVTKQQMAIALLIIPLILFSQKEIIFKITKQHRKLFIFGLISISLIFLYSMRISQIERISGFITSGKYIGELNNLNLFDHIRWTIIHTYREILPWYWGIFKWLGVTLPRWTHRMQMGIIAGAIVGNIVYLKSMILAWRKTKIVNKQDKQILFLYAVGILYFCCLMMWDYFFRRAYGFSFGMQGRYYFPVIVTHMIFIIVGWESIGKTIIRITKIKEKYLKYGLLVLGLWWIILHNIGLLIVTKSYYSLGNISTFINQISQYKPLLFKGNWWILWISLYLLGQIVMLILLFWRFSYEKNIDKNK